MSRFYRRRGFTAVELLVVVAANSLLAAILFPAIGTSREVARQRACQDNLHDIAVGIQSFEEVYTVYPSGVVADDKTLAESRKGWGWGAILLPFLRHQKIYTAAGLPTTSLRSIVDDAMQNPAREILEARIDLYRCPADTSPDTCRNLKARKLLPGVVGPLVHATNWLDATKWEPATSNYVANAGHKRLDKAPNTGPFSISSSCRMSNVKDGVANVFFVGERSEECAAGTWVGSQDLYKLAGNIGSRSVLGSVMPRPNLPFLFRMNNWADLARPGLQIQPYQTNICIDGFASFHPGGTNFAMGDGRVVFIGDNIESALEVCSDESQALCDQNQDAHYVRIGVYQRLGCMADGFPVDPPPVAK